jgi:hypothetical protein
MAYCHYSLMPLAFHPRFRIESKGTFTADGTEQTIREIARIGKVQGYIDFTNMASGDSTIIRTYAKIKSGGSYLLNGQKILSNTQTTLKLMYFFEYPTTNYGFKITLEQEAGTNRAYDYIIFFEG